jgi:hypothetical protein
MHFMEDTEQEDSVGELFWGENFKKILKDKLPKAIFEEMIDDRGLMNVYERLYGGLFSSYEAFVRAASSMIEIGCENGADRAFDDIYFAFRNHLPLPETRRCFSYFWPRVPSSDLLQEVNESLIAEYRKEVSYLADYRDYYSQIYPTFSSFLDRVAELVVSGTRDGADGTIGQMYRCFMLGLPLPPSRRRARRLKGW